MKSFFLLLAVSVFLPCFSEEPRIVGVDNFDSEPVGQERRLLMKSEGLTVPPILLDKNGQRRREIRFTDNTGREIDVVFEPYAVSELPPKKKPVCEIIDEVASKVKAVVEKAEVAIETAKISVPEKLVRRSVQVVTDNDFGKKVELSTKTVCVVFGSKGCGACNRYRPDVESVSKSSDAAEFFFCDVDESPAAAKKYRANSIPFTAIFINGSIVRSVVGRIDQDGIQNLVLGKSNTASEPARNSSDQTQTYNTSSQELRAETFRHASRSPRGM